MIGTRHVIYWSPDNRFLAFLSTNDTNVDRIEFSRYDGQPYPEMVNEKAYMSVTTSVACYLSGSFRVHCFRHVFQVSVAYPKAGRPNPVVTLRVMDLTTMNEYVVDAPTSEVGE